MTSHVWTEEDRDRLDQRAWQCPRRLIESGTWARLWTEGASHGAATSILPVLVLHSWPKRDGKASEWSEWAYIGRRRLAGLAGVTTKTATRGIRELRALGLLETSQEPQPNGRGGYRTRIRLSEELYARPGEDYAEIPGLLIGGGTWAMLPTAAARHLLVVVGAMEPIGDEKAYAAKVRADAGGDVGYPPWWDDYEGDADDEGAAIAEWLDSQRARTPMSVGDFVRWSGVSRRQVVATLPQLLVPMFGTDERFGIVKRGACSDVASHWYALERRALTWYWHADMLNDRERVERERSKLWPPRTPNPAGHTWAPNSSGQGRWHLWNGDGRSICGHGWQANREKRAPDPPRGHACKLCSKAVQ